MPTYNYECEECQHSFEHVQTMTSLVKRKCPDCGKPKLIRLITGGSSVIFKGEGFYSKDYGGKNASDGSKQN